MGEAGRLSARERFSVERMVLDTVRVYQTVALQAHHDDGDPVTSAPPRARRGSPTGPAGTRHT